MLLGCEFIFEDAQTVYLYLDAVARFNGPNSGRRAGGNEVAGFKRHELSDVAEQLGDGEDEVPGRALLFDDAVLAGDDSDRRAGRGSISSETMGPTGQKVSKPLPRVHWPSDFWMSRAVTSLTQT